MTLMIIIVLGRIIYLSATVSDSVPRNFWICFFRN